MKLSVIGFSLVTLLSSLSSGRTADFKPDKEGFIRNWLELGYFTGVPRFGAVDYIEIGVNDGDFAKEGDKLNYAGKVLKWKASECQEYYLDFRKLHGPPPAKVRRDQGGEYRGEMQTYILCYLVAEEEREGLKLSLGCDGPVRVFLNGKQVFIRHKNQEFKKDQEVVKEGITLAKGANCLLVQLAKSDRKEFRACFRFLGKDGKAVTDFKIALQKP